MSLKFRFGRQSAFSPSAGTANLGVKIRTGRAAAGLFLAASLAVLTIACGGSSNNGNLQQTPTTNGALYTFISDQPSCDVLSLAVFLTEMDLHRAGKPSDTLLTVWPATATGSPISPVVEVGNLRDTMKLVNLSSIPPGTYDQIVLKAVVNNSSVYDPSQNPPVTNFVPALSSSSDSVTINLSPALTITSGKVSAVLLDLNLPQSLTLSTDSQGTVTGTINWQFTSRLLDASSSSGFGQMDALDGFVRSVNSSSPGAGFTSSFLLETLPGTQLSSTSGVPAFNVDLTDQTKLVGVSRIDQMPTGSYVEVDGYVDENGHLVANAVQVEDRESLAGQKLAYVGPVLDVTRDSNGNVTQFDMLARETEPGDTTDIPSDTAITVNVSTTTTFNPYLLSDDLTNLASSGNLTLGASTLVPGQEVVVSGVFTKPSSGPITVAADSIYPRLQAVQGTFSALVPPTGSDNKTGAFQMPPCNGLLSNSSFMVATDAQTSFENTSGLSTLSPTTPLLSRGLLFYSVNGTTIQGTGTQVPAGTMVLLAKQVRQF